MMKSKLSNKDTILLLILIIPITSCKSFPKDNIYGKQVSDLINQALASTSQEEQQRAFNSIIDLGCDAVPAMVNALRDSRRLPINYLCLINYSPDSFEAIRQFGPETVTDALAAILNHLTGRDFGFIYNGATDAEREKAIKGWQSFIAKPFSKIWCKDHPVNQDLCFSDN